jgi:hypothetical protein
MVGVAGREKGREQFVTGELTGLKKILVPVYATGQSGSTPVVYHWSTNGAIGRLALPPRCGEDHVADSNGKHVLALPSRPGSTGGTVLLFRPRDAHLPPAMSVIWHSIEPHSRFATATDHREGLRLHIVVEQLPNSTKWDWLVWPAGNQEMSTVGGIAPSVDAAAAAAEASTHHWSGSGPRST